MHFYAFHTNRKYNLSSPRAERARAVTVSQCPHSGVGQDFLLRRRVTLTETAVTRKRKVEKWIRRCQIDRLREGYKRAIDEIRGPIAKKRIFRPKSGPVYLPGNLQKLMTTLLCMMFITTITTLLTSNLYQTCCKKINIQMFHLSR